MVPEVPFRDFIIVQLEIGLSNRSRQKGIISTTAITITRLTDFDIRSKGPLMVTGLVRDVVAIP